MFAFEYYLNPRITDINYGGHLGHTELINLLHEVRLQFLNQYGLNEIDIKGAVLLMRQLTVTYLNQAFWNNNLKFLLEVEITGPRIIFNYLVANNSLHNETAEAQAIMVLFDIKKQKIIKPNLFVDLIKSGLAKTEKKLME